MLDAGTLLQNRYRIKRPLGQGAMGAVYEAEDLRLNGLTVAVKETLWSEADLREQFEREAVVLARLKHAALPKVSDHFVEGSGQFLVMEFIPGDDLKALLERQQTPFPWPQVLEWADRLLDALTYIHARGVIHRDIKPANIKLTPEGEIFLLDFGLSKDGAGLSVGSGTPAYRPPEQYKHVGTDARSDLFSLGATLYHLLTGKRPVNAAVREEKVQKKQPLPDPLMPVHQVNLQIPEAWSLVIARAMALKPKQRYQSAAEMRDAFQQVRHGSETTLGLRVQQEARRFQQLMHQLELEAQQQAEDKAKRQAEARQRELIAQQQREEEARRLAEQQRWAEQQRQADAEPQRPSEQRDLERQRREKEPWPRPTPAPVRLSRIVGVWVVLKIIVGFVVLWMLATGWYLLLMGLLNKVFSQAVSSTMAFLIIVLIALLVIVTLHQKYNRD